MDLYIKITVEDDEKFKDFVGLDTRQELTAWLATHIDAELSSYLGDGGLEYRVQPLP